MTINWQEAVNGADRIRKQQEDAERLERFRRLLTRYRSVWGFAPPAAQFVRLWQQTETVEAANAEARRLAGNA